MVRAHDDRDDVGIEALNGMNVPQRMREIHGRAEESVHERSQRRTPTRRWELDVRGVTRERELGVVDPHWFREVAEHRRDPLAEPR